MPEFFIPYVPLKSSYISPTECNDMYNELIVNWVVNGFTYRLINSNKFDINIYMDDIEWINIYISRNFKNRLYIRTGFDEVLYDIINKRYMNKINNDYGPLDRMSYILCSNNLINIIHRFEFLIKNEIISFV